MDPIGLIFTGGPNSVYDETSPHVRPGDLSSWASPILGICYGCQLMAHTLGGRVAAAQDDSAREYGKTETYYRYRLPPLRGLARARASRWMSHGDYMEKVPEGFALAAPTPTPAPTWPSRRDARGFYGVQFHPEVNHTEYGTEMLRNFLYDVCGASGDWTMDDYMQDGHRGASGKRWATARCCWRSSGGVDSSVAAALLARGRRQPADLRLCGPRPACARTRATRWRRRSRKWDMQLRPRQRRGPLPRQAGRRHRAGAQAQDHRRGVHPRL